MTTSKEEVICGDSLEIMRGFADETFDMVLTSPPYDNLRDYNGFSFDFEGIAHQIARVLKPGGVLVWVVGDSTTGGSETGTSFTQALYFKNQVLYKTKQDVIVAGLNLHDTMIYEKAGLTFPDTNRYYQMFEYMFVFTKGKIKTFNPLRDRVNKSSGRPVHGTVRNKDGTTQPKACLGNITKDKGTRFNIWRIPHASNKERAGHPATFPLQLAKDHILSWSNPGDSVLDPFLGSGTTLLACQQLNRNGVGIEISPEYCEIARQRLTEPKP